MTNFKAFCLALTLMAMTAAMGVNLNVVWVPH